MTSTAPKLLTEITPAGRLAAVNNVPTAQGFRIELTYADIYSKNVKKARIPIKGVATGNQVKVRGSIPQPAANDDYFYDEVRLIDGISGDEFARIYRDDRGHLDNVSAYKTSAIEYSITFSTLPENQITIVHDDNLASLSLDAHLSDKNAHADLFDSALTTVTSWDDLRNQTGVNGKMIFIAPPHAAGGVFYADMADKISADNGATIIVAQDGTRWKRIHDELRPEFFGAVGNGVADDTVAFVKMLEVSRALGKKKVLGNLKYKITQNIDFREIPVDMGDAEFALSEEGKLTIGGHGGSSWNPDQSFGRVLRGRVFFEPERYTKPSIVCIGAKRQRVYLKYVDYFQMYMSTDPATYPRDASQAYSTFDISFAIKIEFATDPRFDQAESVDGAGSANQWCNENIFNLNRCLGLIIGGSYPHNCNLFVGGCFETNKSFIDVQCGNKNHFLHTRLEGVGFVRFGENTQGNILERSYFGSTADLIFNVEDHGILNKVETGVIDKSRATRIFEITPFTPRYNGFVDEFRHRQVSRIIKPTVNYGTLAHVEKFKLVGKKDILYFDFDGDKSKYAFELTIYDEKGNQLDANALQYSSGFLRPQSTKKFIGAPVSNQYGLHRFMLLEDGVFYVAIKFQAGNVKDECKSYNVAIDLFGKYPARQMLVQKAIPANKPTQYIGFAGDVIEYKSGKVSVDLHIQTTAAAKNGSTITLASGALGRETLKAGDAVGIESATGAIQWTTLASAEGEVLTLAEPLADWVAVGDSVYISRLTQIVEYVKAAA